MKFSFRLRFDLEHVFQETSLSVLSTADLLRERLAFITGGIYRQSPILTFPDNPEIELTQEKYKKLVTYLTQVPRYERTTYYYYYYYYFLVSFQ